MSWFAFGRRPPPAPPPPPETLEIPLFPLKTVLLPGARLGLKVFEQRYLDMAAERMRADLPFGICLILSGDEVGPPATPHGIGVLAHIERADMEQLGILQLSVRGGRRFRMLTAPEASAGVLRARVALLPEPAAAGVPDALAGLLPLLRGIAADLGPERMPEPHAWDDAAWVGYRLTEVVPVQALAKQKLLELEDPVARLEILFKYLAQRGLVR